MKQKLLIIFLLVLITTAVEATLKVKAEINTATIRNISVTIMVYNETYEQFVTWITPYVLSFHNFTFLLSPDHGFTWLLANKTRLNFLTSIGEIAPVTYFAIQQNTPQERIKIFTDMLNEWITYTGNVPQGVFMFQPDTLSLNYLYSRNVSYVMGYCFDQYNVDFMTMRGGWQLLYYASSINALMPENTTEKGMVVLPWLTWDWIDSFTLSHLYESETLGCANPDNSGYVINLLERNLDADSPVAYSAFSFDFDWYYKTGALRNATTAFNHLLANTTYEKLSLGNFTAWFKQSYQTTPTYQVNFTSPNSGKQIEWYYNVSYRIARSNNTILSFVDYTHQQPDPYLASPANMDWTQPAGNLTNCIDNSLLFTIDDLGGGAYRAPIKNNSVPYNGNLAYFPEYYLNLWKTTTPKPIITSSPESTPTSTTEFLIASIILLLLVTAPVFTVMMRKRVKPR